MKGGDLRYRGILQKRADGADTSGGPTESWSQFADRRMSYAPLSGREQFLAQQVEAAVNARVGLRYLAGVRPKMRVLMACRTWTTLNGAIDNAVVAVTIAAATGFPAEGNYRIRIDDELLEVTAGQGTTGWTVTRGVDGTTPAAHSNGASVALMVVLDIEAVIDVGGRRRETSLLTIERNG